MDTRELKRLAQIGAATRLAELDKERQGILSAFPTLAAAANGGAGRTQSRQPVRRRHHMSPAERKAVSQRMKKYWAARRRES